MSMKRKLNITFFLFLFFILGVSIAFLCDSMIIDMINEILVFFGGGKIQLTGKYFHFLNTEFYYLSFGISSMLFYYVIFPVSKRGRSKKLGIVVLLFTFTMIIQTILYGYLEYMSCTMCDDGVLFLKRSSISYGSIAGVSIMLSVTILIFDKWIKKSKKNQERIERITS